MFIASLMAVALIVTGLGLRVLDQRGGSTAEIGLSMIFVGAGIATFVAIA